MAMRNKNSFVPQNVPAALTSHQQLQKRGIAGQRSRPSRVSCRGRLQKRGQCLSQLKQKPSQDRQSQGPSKANSKDTRDETSSGRRPARPAMSVIESSLSRISVTSPTSRKALQQDSTEDLKNLAVTPPLIRSTIRRVNSSRNEKGLGKGVAPDSDKVKSAPSLADIAELQAYAAEKKALSIRKAAVAPGVKARDSMYEAKTPLPPGPVSEEFWIAKIQRHEEANADAYTYARQQKKLSRAYSDAADASREAKRPVRENRNKKKQYASKAESDAWRSVAKASSYWAQSARMKLEDSRVQEQTRIALERYGAALHPEAHGLLVHHSQQHRMGRQMLSQKWRDTKELVEQQFHQLTQIRREGGYDSEFDQPLMPDAWPRPPNRDIVRPYTPSPASSRGRSERETRPRRISSDSNRSKYTDTL